MSRADSPLPVSWIHTAVPVASCAQKPLIGTRPAVVRWTSASVVRSRSVFDAACSGYHQVSPSSLLDLGQVEMLETAGDEMLQQLREELFARLWAVHAINPSSSTDGTQAETVARVELVATRWSTLLRDPDPAVRRRANCALQRILWPAFSAPADEWWTTPLGTVLAAIRADGSRTLTPDCVSGEQRTTRELIARRPCARGRARMGAGGSRKRWPVRGRDRALTWGFVVRSQGSGRPFPNPDAAVGHRPASAPSVRSVSAPTVGSRRSSRRWPGRRHP